MIVFTQKNIVPKSEKFRVIKEINPLIYLIHYSVIIFYVCIINFETILRNSMVF